MRKLCVSILAMAAVAIVASPAMAQQRRGLGRMMGNPVFLLAMQESVQKELKTTDEQVSKAREMMQEAFQSFQELRDLSDEERAAKIEEMDKKNDKVLAEVLKPEQHKRLKQISIQRQGVAAFEGKEIIGALKLTDDQKTKIKTIQTDTEQAQQELFESIRAGGGNFEEARPKMDELRKNSTEKAVAVLTDEQKAKWKELTGEPFKGEIVFRRPGQ